MSTQEVVGTLEITERGEGFLRSAERNYAVQAADPLVGRDVIGRYGLRGGERIVAVTGPRKRHGPVHVAEVRSVNDLDPGAYGELKPFGDLTVVDPHERIRFETPGGPTTMRVIDLMTPIGKGQRGLIAAPPRTGKTILLQQMAAGIAANHPEIYMMVLLIDERPEEVTHMRRTVHGETVASSNDKDVLNHVRIARLMIEKAKRMVECGKDVLILLDSLTRLGRAFNAFVGSSGRTMTGGLDIRAMQEPKAMFGAARKIENGGSLTIMATALIDTGSRMDELIFNEFKGTGNMEIMLCRDLANKRIWPAMDLHQSGTRKEELLLRPEELKQAVRIRRRLNGMAIDREMLMLTEALEKFPSNEQFLAAQAV
ncbi:MAG: transcription termination factor Rho [Phycisphaerae bacterium]